MAHFEEAGFSVVMAVPWRRGRRHAGRRIPAIHAIHIAVGVRARRNARWVRNVFRAGDRLVDGSDTDFGSVFDVRVSADAGVVLTGIRKVGAGANA